MFTINRWGRFGQWGAPQRDDQEEVHRYLPGRSPFIVPPAAAKSTFYNNPVTRQLWRDAASSLAGVGNDDVVALLGYSVPPTDLVMSGMLSDRLPDRVAGPIDVVNPGAGEIIPRLADIGVPGSLRPYDGESPIEDYVNLLEYQTSLRVHAQLLADEEAEDLPLVVATSELCGALVTSVSVVRNGQPLLLTIETMGNLFQRLNRLAAEEPVELVRVSHLRGLPATGLSVRYPSGEETQVVALGEYPMSVGPATRWRVLVPSAHPWSVFH